MFRCLANEVKVSYFLKSNKFTLTFLATMPTILSRWHYPNRLYLFQEQNPNTIGMALVEHLSSIFKLHCIYSTKREKNNLKLKDVTPWDRNMQGILVISDWQEGPGGLFFANWGSIGRSIIKEMIIAVAKILKEQMLWNDTSQETDKHGETNEVI